MQTTLQHLLPALSQARFHTNLTADVSLSGVTTDSRRIAPGNLFVALRGDNFDAHDFLEQVASSGAAAVIAERVPANFALPAIVVPDTKLALAETGRYWRQQFTLPVIGVTGSNGKTTVKEMIASILATAFGETARLSTSGNLNNEIGVPLTLLGLTSQHRAAVIEMGMNHPGEIALLASVAQPGVVLVNNAQREHQEFMQTVQAVAEENGSAIRALPQDGVAVFPYADEYSALWTAYAKESGQRRILRFGLQAEAEVSACYVPQQFGSLLTASFLGRSLSIRLHAAGEHNVLNALAAAACCLAIGIADAQIVQGLEAFAPVKGRLQAQTLRNGALLIDDTYNANPDSVRAAIDVLRQSAGPRILVLGDMGEVGVNGPQFHAEIGAYARESGITHLYLLGELVAHAVSAYGAGAQYFANVEGLQSALAAALTADCTVLVKGSRFMKMERVVQYLASQTEFVSTHQ
ncbi:UDP-N-acetylmuramoyl-tripeptide--D-alanyl-D-alanine ligase [Undibacterium rugosum]|nr:UDP-N-acetylmuramoyl-tripeptide--D-alanyl-D-alanine ligase [Undibacterium rugosum]MBR7778406.1 UDP-N-acetylmuramoyl-tripeptide--D-alanyl-D-alanine ligase [Undibacterium rugosum]